MPPKNKSLNIRINQGLNRATKKMAIVDGRSLSDWPPQLIKAEVEMAYDEFNRVLKFKSGY